MKSPGTGRAARWLKRNFLFTQTSVSDLVVCRNLHIQMQKALSANFSGEKKALEWPFPSIVC
jgi:hypothetical protein